MEKVRQQFCSSNFEATLREKLMQSQILYMSVMYMLVIVTIHVAW